MTDVEDQIDGFVGEFAAPVQALIRGCRARLRERWPAAIELVYDNDNFFVIGFGPTTRTSESVVSLACDRHGVLLFFLQHGPELADPAGILQGAGKRVRHLRLGAPGDLDRPEVQALLEAQLAVAAVPMGASRGPQVLVKSVSANRRPRR